MYLPKSEPEIADEARKLRDACMQTQQDRAAFYDLMQKYYLFGSDTIVSDYNKILSHVDTVSAFIFAPGGTRLYIDMPTMKGPAGEAMEQMGDRASRELNSQWHGDGHDLMTMDTVTSSLVYGTMIEKDLWQRKRGGPGIASYQITPYNFGVLREDVADLDRQEAMCHQFFYSADELWRILKLMPNGRALWDRITFQPSAEAEPTMNTLQTVITASQAQGSTLTGRSTPNTALPAGLFRPVIVQDVARAYEIWVWDDMEDDYRILTLIEPDVLLWNEPNFYLPRDANNDAGHPFSKFTPWPVSEFIWGMSEVWPVMLLQGWNDSTIKDIQKLQKLRIKPPIAISGDMGISDERGMAAMWDPGSMMKGDQGAKIEKLVPDMPDDVFLEPDKIDAMFSDMSGMKGILRGEGVPQVRGEQHAQLVARFAGARVNKKALAVEQGLIDSCNTKFRLLRRYDKTRMLTDTGMEFVMDQLHASATVKVDSHSHSPIFAGDQLLEATEALKIGAIDKSDWLEMSHLPGKERLKAKARKRDEAHAKMQEQLMQDPKIRDAVRKKQAMAGGKG